MHILTLDQALALLKRKIKPQKIPTRIIKVQDALGRILAQAQKTLLDVPYFNRATMDGYAIGKNEKKRVLSILETVPAGKVTTQKLRPGTTVRIMTGAQVPRGTEKVIPHEETMLQSTNKVKIVTNPKTTNIAMRGADLKYGDLLLKAGTTISPAVIASLLMCGIEKICVYQQLKIIIITTGDELVESRSQLKPGKIMNTNLPMLRALCQQCGYQVLDALTIADQQHLITQALRQALKRADCVIINGGVSVGESDYVRPAMQEIGMDIHFNRLALKPGRPTTFATWRKKLIFGLPGNPAATFLTFHLLVLPALRHLLNLPQLNIYRFLQLAHSFKRSHTERQEFIPCIIQKNRTLRALPFNSSAHIIALNTCHGFFVLEQGKRVVKRGESVRFLAI